MLPFESDNKLVFDFKQSVFSLQKNFVCLKSPFLFIGLKEGQGWEDFLVLIQSAEWSDIKTHGHGQEYIDISLYFILQTKLGG